MVTTTVAGSIILALFTVQANAAEEPVPSVCFGESFITFESGSSALSSSAQALLNNFVASLEQSATPSRVTVEARTDRLGSVAYNLRLSRRRAAAIVDYLAARGIARSRFEIQALGETRPLAETADEIPEPINRMALVREFPTREEVDRRQAIWARRGRPTYVC